MLPLPWHVHRLLKVGRSSRSFKDDNYYMDDPLMSACVNITIVNKVPWSNP